MSRSISIVDLFTYCTFGVAGVLVVLDWVGAFDGPYGRAAVVLALFAHHVWMRSNGRRHVDEAVSAVVVEHHLRSLGGEVRRLNR